MNRPSSPSAARRRGVLRLPAAGRLLSLVVALAVAGCVQITNHPPGGGPAAGGEGEGEPPSGQQAREQGGEDEGPFEPWEKVLEDTREIEGAFTFHLKRDDTLYLEVPPGRLGEDFGLLLHYSRGLGDLGIQEGLPAAGDTHLMRLRRSGDRIYLVRRNPRFTADPGTPMETSMEDNVGHSVVAGFDIRSREEETGHLLVDVTDFLVSDYAGTSDFLTLVHGGTPVRMDDDRSHVDEVRGFPENVEIDILLTYEASEPSTFGGPGVSDYRSLPVGVRYSIFELPDDPMRPRLADLRVGHFLTAKQDFSRDRESEPYVRYVNRWRLEKEDHSEPVSAPAEPIVYYVDRSVPERYRPYVKEGIEAWNEAFRAAGYERAVVARDAPADSSWSAEDVRHSTVRWTAAHNMGYAIGPSQVDPRTGEILNADILIDYGWIQSWLEGYRELVASGPAAGPGRPAGSASGPGAAAAPMAGARAPRGSAPAGTARGLDRWPTSAELLRGHGPLERLRRARPELARRLCRVEMHRARQLGVQYAVLAARGVVEPGQAMPEEYLGAALKDLVMHEVGHTLGLRHNFKASSGIPYRRLHDAGFTREHGVSLSVMDYAPVNVAVGEREQGHYWNPGVGTYDVWAVRYAYAPVYGDGGGDAATGAARGGGPGGGGPGAAGGAALARTGTPVTEPAAERPALRRLARVGTDSLHTYATDEDAGLGPWAVDPRVNYDDLGSDPLRWGRDRNRLVERIQPELESRIVAEGEPWHLLRGGFSALMAERLISLLPAAKTVGGLHASRDYRGQTGARPPFRPVSAERQREALTLLVEEVFAADAFRFEPELLNRLAPNMWSDWTRSFGSLVPMDYPVHRRVASLQAALLGDLLHPARLERMVDARLRTASGEEALGLPELFGRLTGAIWSELETASSPGPVNSFRRNLQREHLDRLRHLLLTDEVDSFLGATPVPEDARSLARAELSEIARRIDGALASEGSLRPETRAHLEESRARIRRALEASVVLPFGG